MDLTHSTLALAGAQQWILIVCLANPTESTSNSIHFTFLFCLAKDGLHFSKFFKVFVLGICVDRVCTVPLFLICLALNLQCFIFITVTNFLDSKFNSANFEDITFLYLVVHFLILILEAAYY